MSEWHPQSVRASRLWVPATCLFFIALLLTGFGLMMLSSAGAGGKAARPGNPLFIMYQQLRWLPIALFGASVAYFVNLEKLRAWIWWLYGGVMTLLALVLVPGVGLCINGSRRWLDLGPVNMQPSDLAKVALVLALAHYLTNNQRFLRPVYFRWFEKFPRLLKTKKAFPYIEPATPAGWDCLRGFIFPCLIIGGICGLIGVEKDLGTMALCAMVGGAILFVSGVRFFYLIPTALAAVAAFSFEVYRDPTRLSRVTAFIDPEGTKGNEGWQLWQGQIGLACGGITGEGLGQGMQQRYFLPEAHTDFIFAIIGEELGLVATASVAVAFLLFFLIAVSTLKNAHNMFQSNVCLGATLFIVLQAAINMFVVTGLAPTKGMSLPFISYGGTNLVTMYFMLGLILNCLHQWSKPFELVRPSER